MKAFIQRQVREIGAWFTEDTLSIFDFLVMSTVIAPLAAVTTARYTWWLGMIVCVALAILHARISRYAQRQFAERQIAAYIDEDFR